MTASSGRGSIRASRKGTRAAGVVVVRCAGGTYRYLLLRAYRYWDFPKGIVEPGESPFRAARREVAEETGLANLEFRWGKTYIDTPPYAGGKVARYYLALSGSNEVELGVNPVLGRAEHHGHAWFEYEAAGRLLVPRVRAVLDWAHDSLGDRCEGA